jgi:hypothetical protein
MPSARKNVSDNVHLNHQKITGVAFNARRLKFIEKFIFFQKGG